MMTIAMLDIHFKYKHFSIKKNKNILYKLLKHTNKNTRRIKNEIKIANESIWDRLCQMAFYLSHDFFWNQRHLRYGNKKKPQSICVMVGNQLSNGQSLPIAKLIEIRGQICKHLCSTTSNRGFIAQVYGLLLFVFVSFDFKRTV